MRNKIILQKSITINEYIEILEKEKYLFILDSSKVNDNQSNYTYIGVNPVDYLIIDRDDQNKIEILEDLNSFYKRYSKRTDQGIEKEKFYTGFLSFFSYDLGLIFMDIDKDKTKTKSRVPYSFIGYYPVIIRIDKEGNSILYYEEEYKNKAKDLIDKVNIGYGNISKEKENKNGYPNNKYNLIYEEKFKEYEKKINKIKEYIYEGDIYQVNYTRQFVGEIKNFNTVALYLSLRKKNPAPFSSLIIGDYWEILSTSPERLIKNINGKLITRPIKGTIEVSSDPLENERNKELLLNSIKDKSELLMIVDLERNDLSKISVPGTVKVEELYKLETYETVHHLVSTISCMKNHEYTPIEVIYNIFPGGSITGTPKKRAMEIIEELEEFDRGVYTGSIGYIDHNGNFDFNIAIRTVVIEDKKIKFNVGGGITWKSKALDEFKETEAKGLGMMKGLGFENNI